MSKQKFTLSVGLVLMLVSSLMVLSIRANAGQAVIQGTTPDSSGTNGDSFAPVNQGTSPQPAPNTGVSVGGDGVITTPPLIQDNLNNTARNIVSRSNTTNLIIVIILRGVDAERAVTQVKTAFVDLGASPEPVQKLVNSLLDLLFQPTTSATPGVPAVKLTSRQLVATLKAFKAGSAVSQGEATPNVNINAANVDINKLNAAINAYNQIVQESSLETLQKLSQDANFQEAGRVLKELRAALKQH
jgi:hypothetical protein